MTPDDGREGWFPGTLGTHYAGRVMTREAREAAAEADAQRDEDARRRPAAAALVALLDAAIAARTRSLSPGQLAHDAQLAVLGSERRAAAELLEMPGCDPDLSDEAARNVLMRCGLVPAAPAEAHADRLSTTEGAPEPLAGAPASAVPPALALDYRGAAAETARRINAAPADPTKAEVEIHGQRVALYLVAGPDGRERWISEPLPVADLPREGWAGTAYRVAVADREGRAVALGTIPARHQRHAENRARKLGARLW